MQFVLIAIALYLALYAPGRYVLRPPRDDGAAGGSQLLREVLLSAGCTSWIGFLLAELGWYSTPLLLASLAAIALVGRVLRRGAAAAYGIVDLRGIVLLGLTCLWVAAPLDTRLLASDSSGYIAGGAHLARHGSMIIHDPTLATLSVDLKRTLFPSVAPDRGAPPYLRLQGSMILRSLDSDEVLLAFHQMITVWIALFHSVGGPAAAQWVATLFGGLSVWAVTECAAALGGATLAWMLAPLLWMLAPQYWYARFLMPEIPGQFFLWSGLWCMAMAQRGRSHSDFVLAGAAFGIAGLMRIENAVFLALALPLAMWLSAGTPRGDYCRAALAALPFWMHAIVHVAIFRTHYYGQLFSLVTYSAGLRSSLFRSLVVATAAGATWLVWRWYRRAREPFRARMAAAVVGSVLAAAVLSDYGHGWPGLRLLISFTGPVTLIGGGIGLLWSARELDKRPRAYQLLVIMIAIVFVQVVLEPHTTPIALWTVRRALTIVLPGFCIGIVILVHQLAQRWHWGVQVALLTSALVGQWRPAHHLWERPYYQGSLRHVQAVGALIPPGARLLYDSQLIGSGFAESLWTLYDTPGYFFSPNDTARLSELAQALGNAPLYWINNGTSPPPRIPGVAARSIAFYEFTLTTPAPDVESAPTGATTWDYTVAVYALQIGGDENKSAREDRP